MKNCIALKTLSLLLMMAIPLIGNAQASTSSGGANPVSTLAADSVHVNLQKALEIALAESPTIRIANRDIETKKYYRSEQLVGLFPDVSASASYQRTLQKQKMAMDFMGQATEIEVGTNNNIVLGANLTMPLVAPALWQSLKLTAMDIDLAIEQARSSKIVLTNNVKKAFYALLVARETHQVLLDNMRNLELTAKNTTDKFNQGLESEFEKLRADVQVQNAKPELNAAKNAMQLSERALKVYMGVDINEPLIFEGDLNQYENEISNFNIPPIESFTVENNSDIRQADMGIAQLERSRKIVLAGSLPTLGLSGSYQYMTQGEDVKFSEFNWFPYSVIGVSLQIPLVSWASTNYKLKQTKNDIMNMNDNKLNLERSIWLSIATQLNNIDKALADFESTSESIRMAQRAYDIARTQYDVGLATFLDLSNSELALIRSQLQYNQSIYDYLVAQSELEHLLGTQN